MKIRYFLFFILMVMTGVNCSGQSKSKPSSKQQIQFSPNNGGLNLPKGFKAIVVADNVGSPRHIAVAKNGDIYVILRHAHNGYGMLALRDTTGNGVADVKKYFGKIPGTGIQIYNGYLYGSSPMKVFRYPMRQGKLVPDTSNIQIVASGFLEQHEHAPKSFIINPEGKLFVNVGAPSNSCQKQDRTKDSPGINPCPLLKRHAGIWEFDANKLNQTQTGDDHYSTGTRNVVGLAWNTQDKSLFLMQHGRDQLYQNWPQYYSKKQSAELPAEEMFKDKKGNNFGWPYSYYDQIKRKIMLEPEYGGNGKKTIAQTKWKGKFVPPVMAFPGHWAPDGFLFYTANQFPAKYQNGAFVAFHGSWNRAPLPQEGYKIVFAPFKNGMPTGLEKYSNFATGFAGTKNPQPGSAKHRPCGLAVGPNGSLYVTDDSGGTIFRIMYTGNK